MPDHDLALLTDAARAAGAIALHHWKKTPQVWDKPGQGPVTEADLAVNDMLGRVLRHARPGYGWLSEESPDDPARLGCEYVFIIDPIDGTRAFIAGEDTFSHSLAVARGGKVVAAVVYLPVLDRLYTATSKGPALRDGVEIRASACKASQDATLLVTQPSLAPELWPGGVPEVRRAFRASLAYRLCLVAEGRHDGMVSFRPTWEWDCAAGSLIASRAGALVSDGHGRPAKFNRPAARLDGVIVAAAGLHGELVARRQPRSSGAAATHQSPG